MVQDFGVYTINSVIISLQIYPRLIIKAIGYIPAQGWFFACAASKNEPFFPV